MRSIRSIFLIIFAAASVLAQQAVEQNLKVTIQYLASDKLEGRRTGEDGATAAAKYIARQFQEIGLTARLFDMQTKKLGYLQSFGYAPSPAELPLLAYNVIGVLPGRDPLLKDQDIVIGAHYDHLGRGGQGSLAPSSHEIHHGA